MNRLPVLMLNESFENCSSSMIAPPPQTRTSNASAYHCSSQSERGQWITWTRGSSDMRGYSKLSQSSTQVSDRRCAGMCSMTVRIMSSSPRFSAPYHPATRILPSLAGKACRAVISGFTYRAACFSKSDCVLVSLTAQCMSALAARCCEARSMPACISCSSWAMRA